MNNEGGLLMWPEADLEHHKRAVQVAGVKSGVTAIEQALATMHRELGELDRLNEAQRKLDEALRSELANARKNSERLMWLYYNGVWCPDGPPSFEEWCASIDAAQELKEAGIAKP